MTHDATTARRPRPKLLTVAPALFVPRGGGGGLVLVKADSAAATGREIRPGGASGETDEEAEIVRATRETDVDPAARARARQIAARLAVPRPPLIGRRRGAGELRSAPYRGVSDELDLDLALEQLVEHPYPVDEDLIVRERMREPRSVVLLVDVSGSMRGERVRTAAAAVGALAAELERDRLAVVAFWSDAAMLARLGDAVRPMELLDALLQLPSRGLTNVAFPLQLAAEHLDGSPPHSSRVILLSDCVHNAGPDPRIWAPRLPRLDVLVDTSGENNLDLARDLARHGRGRLHPVRTHLQVAPALGEMFRP